MPIDSISKRTVLFGEIGERDICHFVQGFGDCPDTEQSLAGNNFISGSYGDGVN